MDCILSGVQNRILFRGKILVMWKSILFRKKNFFGALVVKSILSHRQKIYMVLVQWTGKSTVEKLIVNLFLMFNCSLVFKRSEILIQFNKLT